MNIDRIFLSYLILFLAVPVLAMEDHGLPEPMKIEDEASHDEQQSLVPALKQLCFEGIESTMRDWFKDPKLHHKLLAVPPSSRDELWYHAMYGTNPLENKRNRAILWLASKYQINNQRRSFDGSSLAAPLNSYENLRIQINVTHSFKEFAVQDVLDIREFDAPEAYKLEVIDSETSNPVFVLNSESKICLAQFSHDGKHLYVIAKDKTINIFRTDTWQLVHKAQLQCRMAHFVMLTPDNNGILCGSRTALKMHDALSGETLCNLMQRAQTVIDNVKLSQDGNIVYVFYDRAEDLFNENVRQHANVPNAPDPIIDVHQFDITPVNNLLNHLARLTLEQLLTLEIVHNIANNQEKPELLRCEHINNHYNALPFDIRTVIERVLPVAEIPRYSLSLSRNEEMQSQESASLALDLDLDEPSTPGGESEKKRRKTDDIFDEFKDW